ncbi:MAG: Outer rane efflux protein [Verrucomicrobiales bacterium]|nr:Outer rane efflux protein [Verrucomicrobiales bacterium]
MIKGICDLRFAIYACAVVIVAAGSGQALEIKVEKTSIDLPTVLRLAGAQNIDVQIAREKLTEAQVAEEQARQHFYPWIAPGIGYRRHEGQIQDVSGNMFRADKQSYNLGATVNAQLDLGDAIYKTLAAKQLTKAAGHALASQQLQSVSLAAQNYFELAKAEALIRTTEEAMRVSENYEEQVQHAVEGGVAFAGDKLRVAVQTGKFRFALEQARAQKRLASARLAEVLRLKISEELSAIESDVAPLTLIETNFTLNGMVQKAFTNRPELKGSRALVSAAEENKKAATRGVWIPTLGAQAFAGGLGGGKDSAMGNFSDTADFSATVSWRVGPGGILDSTRVDASKSQLQSAKLRSEKILQQIEREVIEAAVQVQSLGQLVESARAIMKSATENVRLTTQRKEFAVGIVFEVVQAQQDLARAKMDYFSTVADFNKAQYALAAATGQIK